MVQSGLNAEVEMRDAGGMWRGTADLIRVEEHGVEIIDFKTGVAKDEHALQLRLYARLFLEDRIVNPAHLPVTKLTLIYADREVELEVPSGAGMLALASEFDGRANQAQQKVTSMPPEARPSPEACGFCSVRHMCPSYWSPAGQALAGVSAKREGLVDAEVRLHERTAQTTWKASVAFCGGLANGASALVRCPRENESLASTVAELVRGRVLSAQLIQPTEDSGELPVLNMTRASEVFVLEGRP